MEKLPSNNQSLWVYNPWLDLLAGCGAWSGPLLLLGYLGANSNAVAWPIVFYALALLFNYPHYMATIYRAYHTQEDFRKYRIFTVHITALVVVTLLLLHFWKPALPWIFTLYLCWSPWHYSGQNYGLLMMFARRAGAKPTANVRQALYSAFLLSYLILLLNFHTGGSSDPLFLSLGIPEKVSFAVILILGAGFAGFSIFALLQLGKETGWKPLVPVLTLFATQFLWFLLPTTLSLIKGLQIPQGRYSTGVMAVMHSVQYLWITSYYARREASEKSQLNWRPFAYFAVLITGGIALFVPGPWLASKLFHSDFAASFLIFTSVVNIHHFILDGAIWKLRDGRIASLLLNSQRRVSQGTTEAKDHAVAGLRWLAGSTQRAHAFRMTVAMLLLGWAALDQMHYYLRLHAENLADLQFAATLNSFDSSLQNRLGRKQFEAGQSEAAVTAWRNALRLNPADSAARNSLLQYLTAQKSFDEAYRLAQQSLRFAPHDVNLLLNYGILARQTGHASEAVQNWKRAIALDPTQMLARLYLATELQQEGKCDEAVPQYVGFLGRMMKAEPSSRPFAANTVPALFGLAQCQEKIGSVEDAEKSYQLAAKIAVMSGDKNTESLASIYQARLKLEKNQLNDALSLYQHALRIDRTLNDPHAEAQDWYAYGMLLRDHGFPVRLSYASFLKSELTLKTLKEEAELKLVSDARVALEKKEKPVTPANLPTALDEALNVKAK